VLQEVNGQTFSFSFSISISGSLGLVGSYSRTTVGWVGPRTAQIFRRVAFEFLRDKTADDG
jgi:hypothetical protein